MGHYPLMLTCTFFVLDCLLLFYSMYNIVKTGFIIEFNDRAEIQQHSSEEGGGVLSAVASARDIGRRRDQAHQSSHLSPRCRHQQ